MENKIQDILITYINKFGDFVEKAIDTAMEEVPKIIKEYLDWSFWEAVVCLTFDIILIIAFAFLIKISLKKAQEIVKRNIEVSYCDKSDSYVFLYILSFIFLAFIAILINCMFSNVKTIVKIQIAPRIFLIEKATQYIQLKSMCSEQGAKNNHPIKCSNF